MSGWTRALLVGTSISHARFDMSVSSKFYGVSLDGEILTGFVNIDNAKLGCAIRNKRGLSLDPDSTVATIKGYAFVASGYDVGVLNTTGAGRKPPRQDLLSTHKSTHRPLNVHSKRRHFFLSMCSKKAEHARRKAAARPLTARG